MPVRMHFRGFYVFLLACILYPPLLFAAPGQINIDQFISTPSGNRFITTESAVLMKHLQMTFQLQTAFAYQPFAIAIRENDTITRYRLIDSRLQAAMGFSIGLWDWVELSLSQFGVWQDGALKEASSVPSYESYGLRTMPTIALGDLQLNTKIKCFNWRDGRLALALLPQFIFPYFRNNYYISGSGVQIIPTVLFGFSWPSLIRLGIQGGYHWRGAKEQLVSTVYIGDSWTAQAALAVDLTLGKLFPIEWVSEIWAKAPFQKPFASGASSSEYAQYMGASNMEGLTALRLAPSFLRADLGVGTNFWGSFGTPTWRVFASVAYVYQAPIKKLTKPSEKEDHDDILGNANTVDSSSATAIPTQPLAELPTHEESPIGTQPPPLEGTKRDTLALPEKLDIKAKGRFDIIWLPPIFSEQSLSENEKAWLMRVDTALGAYAVEDMIGIRVLISEQENHNQGVLKALKQANTIRSFLVEERHVPAKRLYIMSPKVQTTKQGVELWITLSAKEAAGRHKRPIRKKFPKKEPTSPPPAPKKKPTSNPTKVPKIEFGF
jgi:hypothetical protein